MESKYPRMHINNAPGNLWGDYYKPLRRKRRPKHEPTSEEIKSAMTEYLNDGGKITILEPSAKLDELSKIRHAEDFTETFENNANLVDIF